MGCSRTYNSSSTSFSRSNNTNKWDAQELFHVSKSVICDQIIPINGMLKNPIEWTDNADKDQIIPINGMLKNMYSKKAPLPKDQIIPINGMLKNWPYASIFDGWIK